MPSLNDAPLFAMLTEVDRRASVGLNFLEYAELLAHCGEEGRSLDRIDNDGHYEPGNLRWATRHVQATNTSATRWLTRSDGERYTISEWSRVLGFAHLNGIQTRLHLGWSLDEALWTPKGGRRRCGPSEEDVTETGNRFRFLTRSDGQTMTLTEWSQALGFATPTALHLRLGSGGWTQEEALWTPCGEKKRSGPV